MLGYNKNLYILPFDHRAFFAQSLFGFRTTDELNAGQRNVLSRFKMMVYEGFKLAVNAGVPKDNAAILCDEEFGSEVLADAKRSGYLTILTVEKSGAKELDFRYEEFGEHISRFSPSFTKILLSYNPKDERSSKDRQKNKLKIISDYSHDNNYKFILEVLVNPTEEQLTESNGEREDFDTNLRPDLTAGVIKEFQDFGIEPDVWKLEGLNSSFSYEKVVAAIKNGGRKDVSLVILGRSESEEKVEKWLKVGSKVRGVIGFAVGRTVFWDALEKFYKGEIAKDEAIQRIGKNYLNFYKIFTEQSTN